MTLFAFTVATALILAFASRCGGTQQISEGKSGNSGAWHIETVERDLGNTLDGTSISLDSRDNPHISYSEARVDKEWQLISGNVKYAHFDGASWQIETVGSEGDGGNEASIALDSSDNPHISYTDWPNSYLMYAYYDGASWHIETVDTTTSNFQGGSGDPSLAIDSEDYPHISYLDSPRWDLKYAYFDGASWRIETVDSEGDVGVGPSLTLDSSDSPHISYFDRTNKDLKYAHYDGAAWQIVTIDGTVSTGHFSSIAVDSSDNLHISYCEDIIDDEWTVLGGNLKYAYFDGAFWRIETIDSGASLLENSSIDLDSTDYPHISYYDHTNDDLKYAFYDGYEWNIETIGKCQGGRGNSIALDSSNNPHISYSKAYFNWNWVLIKRTLNYANYK